MKARNGPKRLAWGAAATTRAPRAAETAEPIDLRKLTKWCIRYTTKEAAAAAPVSPTPPHFPLDFPSLVAVLGADAHVK